MQNNSTRLAPARTNTFNYESFVNGSDLNRKTAWETRTAAENYRNYHNTTMTPYQTAVIIITMIAGFHVEKPHLASMVLGAYKATTK